MEREYHHQIRVQNEGYNKKVAPMTAPKPYTSAPTPFRSGPQTYRPVHLEDESNFPPPPPPDMASGYGHNNPDNEFPPPPPPAPPQAYGEDDNSHIYGNVYSGEARYMRTDDYRSPSHSHSRPSEGARYPPPHNLQEHGQQQGAGPESHYANIQINIAPPTPTNKEFGHQDHHEVYTYGSVGAPQAPVSSTYAYNSPSRPRVETVERPVPGPMVPPNANDYSVHVATSTPPSAQAKEKEAEVDALTDLLLKNMTSPSQDQDLWGLCGRCGQTVTGENNACTALDNVYHTSCFTCVGCNGSLHGKSFFALESKPYCEECYLASLERCSVCSKPITDRLLRATGKPYHPDCFTCVVCGISLDGIPFTVDATNQIHCIEDFHKKFAPRCCMCQKAIMPSPGEKETVRIVAMDRSFHVDCYRCEDCHVQLSSEAEGRGCYPLDDHILCKNCNAKRIQMLTTKMSTEL